MATRQFGIVNYQAHSDQKQNHRVVFRLLTLYLFAGVFGILLATCAWAQKSETQRPTASEIKSTPISGNTRDYKTMMALIMARDTPYIQRLAAAYRADEWFAPENLGNLMATFSMIRRETALDRKNDHASAIGPTWDEECKAPWRTQVSSALSTLMDQCRYHDQKDTSWWERLTNIALELKVKSDDDAWFYCHITSPQNVWSRPEVLVRLLDIAKNPLFPDATGYVIQEFGQHLRDPITYPMIVELLRKSPHKKLHGQLGLLATHIAKNQKLDAAGKAYCPLPTAVLVMSRYAVDPKTGDQWSRLYSYAFKICEIVDDPPFKPEFRMDPASELVASNLTEFAVWFKSHEAELIAASEKERPEIENALEKLKQKQ